MNEITRLSVNMNVETAETLKSLAEARGVSYTETVRRAISILNFMDGIRSSGGHIYSEDDTGRMREIILL